SGCLRFTKGKPIGISSEAEVGRVSACRPIICARIRQQQALLVHLGANSLPEAESFVCVGSMEPPVDRDLYPDAGGILPAILSRQTFSQDLAAYVQPGSPAAVQINSGNLP